MEKIVLDLETAVDRKNGYTLTRMTYLEYVRDPRFQVLCGVLCRESLGFKPQFFRGPHLPDIDWNNVELITHNTHFDGLILAEHYGIIVKRYTDTLAYSRYHNKGSTLHGLDDLATFYGIPGKTADILSITDGKNLSTLSLNDWINLETYTLQDGSLGTYIWQQLEKHIPEHERIIQDMTYRCAFEPMLLLDRKMLAVALREARDKRRKGIGQYDIDILRSRSKFADKLRALGIEPPMKLNAKGNPTYAFSKKDEAFMELTEHPDDAVKDLVEAKLESSANITITRARRLAKMSKKDSKFIVTLQPSGAETTDRWSGGGKVNVQNFTRGGKIRQAITAPPGYLLFVPDQSQIECRINATLSDHHSLIQAFREGRDIYSEEASGLYGYPVDRKLKDADGNYPHEIAGFVGKTVTLGCGYQTGWKKLQSTLATSEKKLKITDTRAQQLIGTYRTRNWPIVANWERMESFIWRMMGTSDNFTYKWLEFSPRDKRIYFPDGSSLLYTNLQRRVVKDFDGEDREKTVYWRATTGWTDIYGGKLTENICQKTSNSIIKQNILDIYTDLGLPFRGQEHDALYYLVPEHDPIPYCKHILKIMSTPKGWFETIPVTAEGKLGRNYGPDMQTLKP